MALPFILLSSGIIWQLTQNERQSRRDAILYSVRVLMNAADAELSKQIAIAQVLATSPSLQNDDYAAFRTEASRVEQSLSGSWIVIADETGQQTFNLARSPGTPLGTRNADSVRRQKLALQSGRIQISGVFLGTIRDIPIVTVDIPVVRPGKPPLGLALIVDTNS